MRAWNRADSGRRGWPAKLGPIKVDGGTLTVRAVRLRDARAWSRLRIENQNQLMPWEPTGVGVWSARHNPAAWPGLHSVLRAEAKAGNMLPMAIELNGEYCGQLTVGNIQRGALRNAWIGYWVDSAVTGRGVATGALALGVDHCFGNVGLHRLEATVQPDNGASLSVLHKVGFRDEGLLKRYMDVNSAWRDHILLALTVEEMTSSATEALVRAGRASY